MLVRCKQTFSQSSGSVDIAEFAHREPVADRVMASKKLQCPSVGDRSARQREAHPLDSAEGHSREIRRLPVLDSPWPERALENVPVFVNRVRKASLHARSLMG